MKVATVADIPVRLHWSFLIFVAIYAAIAMAAGGFTELTTTMVLVVALFGSVLLHELGHAMAARYYGIDTAHITLFPFGGIAAITEMPTIPRQEFVIALAGPAVNFALVAAFGIGWTLLGGWLLLALVAVNLIMGVFNLIPAFPMDGGRILRAILARRMGWIAASELSMRVGSVFGWLFLAIGVIAWLPGLFLVGGFLLFAVRAERSRLIWMLARGWRPRTGDTPAAEPAAEGVRYRAKWRLTPPEDATPAV